MLEADASSKLHFSLGRWISHNWGFYEGSRLSHYIKTNLGITYPDDMSRFIIVTYHRNLNRKPLDVKTLMNGYLEKRDSAFQQELQKGTIIEEWTRKREGGGSQ